MEVSKKTWCIFLLVLLKYDQIHDNNIALFDFVL